MSAASSVSRSRSSIAIASRAFRWARRMVSASRCELSRSRRTSSSMAVAVPSE